MNTNWKRGDWAVYRKSKNGSNPGRRASQVMASSKGESYCYIVDKFWIVDDVLSDGRLKLITARGKVHTIEPEDPNLRRPSILQRLLWRERFVAVEQSLDRKVDSATPQNSVSV